MALFDDLMAQAGYVQLSRYGLKLTPDGRIVQTSPRVLPLLDGSGGCRVVGWQEQASVSAPQPAPRKANPPALIVEDEPEPDADADEWEWQLALARAKAAAEDTGPVARTVAVQPQAPSVRPVAQVQPRAAQPSRVAQPPARPVPQPTPAVAASPAARAAQPTIRLAPPAQVAARKPPPVPSQRPPAPARAPSPAPRVVAAPVRSASSPTIAVRSRPPGVPITPAAPVAVAPVAPVARPTRTIAGSVPAPTQPAVASARRMATGTGSVRETRPMPTVAPGNGAFDPDDTRVDRTPAPTPIRAASPSIVRRPVTPVGMRPQVVPPIRVAPRAVAR